jgi:prefoldin subunit 5
VQRDFTQAVELYAKAISKYNGIITVLRRKCREDDTRIRDLKNNIIQAEKSMMRGNS